MPNRYLSFDILDYLKRNLGYQDPIAIATYLNIPKVRIKETLSYLHKKKSVGRKLFRKPDKNLYFYKYQIIKWKPKR